MSSTTKPPLLHDVAPERILDLDVRADLRSGKDPFSRIMHARHALADDGVLRLRAVFEPRPLYAVLGGEGFQHWTERLDADDWRVWFYRDPEASPPAPPEEAPAARPRRPLPTCGGMQEEPADVVVLDVRGLEPPEPLVRTLEAAARLPEGHTLLQINVREPELLFPQLHLRGLHAFVCRDGDEVRVLIRHAEPTRVLDVRLLPPRRKHPMIFETFDGLAPGEAFVILNDHDPMPLRYQFERERPDAFAWRYLSEGPERWRVEIVRVS